MKGSPRLRLKRHHGGYAWIGQADRHAPYLSQLVASEAAGGNEFNAWSVGNQPFHETVLPFTRFMGGPMDYTPGIFKIKMNHATTKTKRTGAYYQQTTGFICGLLQPDTNGCRSSENYYQTWCAFQFIRDVATDWDDMKILAAEPGERINGPVNKNASNWFVGGITDENARTISVDFFPRSRN